MDFTDPGTSLAIGPLKAVRLMLEGHDGMRSGEQACAGCGAALDCPPGASWPEKVQALHRHQWQTLFGVDISDTLDALAMLVDADLHGALPGGDSGDHALIGDADGDGWNEPFSERFSCSCETWAGIEWTQTDPACTGRPDRTKVAIAWRRHYLEVTGQTADLLSVTGTLL